MARKHAKEPWRFLKTNLPDPDTGRRSVSLRDDGRVFLEDAAAIANCYATGNAEFANTPVDENPVVRGQEARNAIQDLLAFDDDPRGAKPDESTGGPDRPDRTGEPLRPDKK